MDDNYISEKTAKQEEKLKNETDYSNYWEIDDRDETFRMKIRQRKDNLSSGDWCLYAKVVGL